MNRSESLLDKINNIVEVSKLKIIGSSVTYFKTRKAAEKLANSQQKGEDPKDPERFIYVVQEVPRPKGSKLGAFFVQIQEVDGFVVGQL